MGKKIVLLISVFSACSFTSYSEPIYNIGTVNVQGYSNTSKFQSKYKKSKKHKQELLANPLSYKDNMKADFFQKIIKNQELKVAGPLGATGSVLSYAPGVAVNTYSIGASNRYSISINGIQQGWTNFSGAQGITFNGNISVTFDGVPALNPLTELFQFNLIPQLSLIQGINISYGPGDPVNRWFNTFGGNINFIPLQPKNKFSGFVDLAYGSFSQRNIAFALNTGKIHGWKTIIAGGFGAGNSYITTTDGHRVSSHNYAFYLKTKKDLEIGDISFGAYTARSVYFRNAPIPISPISGITINGDNQNGNPILGTPLSQQTTGFYSAPPFNLLHKQNQNGMVLLYQKANLVLDKNLLLHDILWFREGYRRHDHYNNFVSGNPGSLIEHDFPNTQTYGEKLWFDLNNIYYNNFSLGEYLIHSRYVSRASLWSPEQLPDGLTTNEFLPNGFYKYNIFNQTDLAAFLQDKIQYENFSITPGIRYVFFNTDYSYDTCQYFPVSCQLGLGFPAGGQGGGSQTKSFSKLEPSISASYGFKFLKIFGNYAETYKTPDVGGGAGPYQGTPASEVHLEKNSEYQLGIKSYISKEKYIDKLFAGIMYFHMLFTKLYFPIYNANDVYLGDGAGNSTYEGVDTFVNYYPTNRIKMFLNYTYEKAKYPIYIFINSSGSTSTYSNLPVSYVPTNLLNAGVSYTFLARFNNIPLRITPNVWMQYVGSQYIWSNQSGTPSNQKMPSYTTFNGSIDIKTPELSSYLKGLDINLTVLNIFNKKYNQFEYISSGGYYNTSSGGYILAYPGAPITFEASVRYKF